MSWPTNVFDALVQHYPRGPRDEALRFFDFTDIAVANPNTCAVRLSYALGQAIPGCMAAYRGTTWTTRSGMRLARSSRALARYIRDQSGWSRQQQTGAEAGGSLRGYFVPPGQGIMYWKGRIEAKYHIDLWDRDRHLDASNGHCMLWRPEPADTLEVWYWQLDPPRTMLFGHHELGVRGTYR